MSQFNLNTIEVSHCENSTPSFEYLDGLVIIIACFYKFLVGFMISDSYFLSTHFLRCVHRKKLWRLLVNILPSTNH